MRAAAVFSIGFVVCQLVYPAWSEERAATSYSVDDVMANLIAQADLGQARALCIGTKSECAKTMPKAAGFDMQLEFDHDSAELTQAAKSNLEIVAVALKDDRLRRAKFNVSGHTDAFGTEEYNDDLSLKRANAVSGFLLAKNIESSRIEAVGMGESEPRSDDPYDPKNRYVELQLFVE